VTGGGLGGGRLVITFRTHVRGASREFTRTLIDVARLHRFPNWSSVGVHRIELPTSGSHENVTSKALEGQGRRL